MIQFNPIRVSVILCVLLLAGAIARSAGAEEKSAATIEKKADSKPEDAKAKDDSKSAVALPDAASKPVRITNTVTIAGQRVTYAAETGMLPLLKTDGASRASVFYTAYTKLEETNKAARPVMFCFNGGPGSSAVWLHLGGLGPRRAKLNDDGTMPPPPFGNGMARAIKGAVIPSTVADLWLQTAPKQPNRKPMSRLPQSPRKIDAGLKL